MPPSSGSSRYSVDPRANRFHIAGMNRPLVIAQAERIVLRREAPGDLEAWLEHLNTPEVTAHLGGPRTPEEVAEKVRPHGRATGRRTATAS